MKYVYIIFLILSIISVMYNVAMVFSFIEGLKLLQSHLIFVLAVSIHLVAVIYSMFSERRTAVWILSLALMLEIFILPFSPK